MKGIFWGVLLAHLALLAILAMLSGGGESPDSIEEQPLIPVDGSDRTESSGDKSERPTSSVSGDSKNTARTDEAPLALDHSRVEAQGLPETLSQAEVETGILVELPSGRVLWERASEQAVPIASMTKMMTALLAFEDEQRRDDVSFDTVIPVSEAAYSIGGSQVWLDPRESFTLRELMISIMVKSANDSAYLVGEFLSGGDMPAFVQRMNERAAQLGMKATRFINAHGLPSDGESNTASSADLVRLGQALLHFEKATEWASIPNYTFRAQAPQPTQLTNHNKLVVTYPGVDGLKTGYTSRAGYCVTATCEREGRRMVAVVTGFGSAKQRDAFVAGLLDWAYEKPADS